MPVDYAQAVQLYRKAADQGIAQGQANLARMYAHGHGLPKNTRTAYFWWLVAAEQGNADAQKNLKLVDQGLSAEDRASAQADARGWKPK